MMVASADENFRDIADIKTHLSNLSSGADHSDGKDESTDQLLRPDALLLRQRLQILCRNVLLSNLEASLDQKIETDLWNFAFKAQITALQQAIKAKSSNTKRTELQADFHLFLESALGFYMQLLENICETFHLHPHFRRKYSSFGIIQGRVEVNRRAQLRLPSRTSSMYICQYCLVHLGDIARYLQRISLAENFYNLAATYVPSNGQPYNQLAILCSTRSNKLAVTYYYIRSIAVRSPFPVAPTNLEKLYAKQVKDCENTNFSSKNKWTHGDVVTAFLYLQALVHLETEKEKALKLAELLHRCLCSPTILSLLSSQNLSHMVAISIFTLSQIDCSGAGQSLTDEEIHFRDVSVGFLVGLLEVMLNQAQKYNVREHTTLPCIKIILGWLVCREEYLANSQVKTHRCWLNLAKALNAIQSHCKDQKAVDLSKYNAVPLPEDVELQCFLPLAESHDSLDFSLTQTLQVDPADITRLRCNRLVDLGKLLCEKYPSLNIIDYKVNAKNTKIIFSASTAVKLEPSRKKPNNRNVAIQLKNVFALKSQDPSPSTSSTAAAVSDATQDDLSMWPMTSASPFGLATSDSSYTSGLDKVSSYSSFQSDVTPSAVGSGVVTPPNLPSFGLAAQANPSVSEGFLPRSNSQGASLGLTSHHQASSQCSQGVIGHQRSARSRTVAELIDATSTVDPIVQAPTNYSASDSSIFAQPSSYSLFSPTFPPPTTSTDSLPRDDSVVQTTSYLPQHNALSSSTGWPASTPNQHNRGLESNWGKSALAQLLEEQQKRTSTNK